MDMRQYRVIGTATYLDRARAVKRIHVSLTIEAPDANTAAVLMLAEIDVRKGASVEYDPEARWEYPPTVEDETAEHEAIAKSGLVTGMKVLHRSGGSVEKGADARQGVIRRIYAISKQGVPLVRCSVDWPAPNRINGDGWHRSDVLASAIVPATEEEVERRRALNKARNARIEAQADAARPYLCTNVNPSARVSNDGHPRPLPLLPSQVQDSRCIYCGGLVQERVR